MKNLKLIGVVMFAIFTVSCASVESDKNDNIEPTEKQTIPIITKNEAGFQTDIKSEQREVDKVNAERQADLKSIYELIDNKTDKGELITTEYSLESLQKFARNGSPFYGYAFSVKEMNEIFPIECLRKLSDKSYYAVYKVKEGGFLYAHLIYIGDGTWMGEDNSLELSNSYYLNEKNDIGEIRIGESITDSSALGKSILNSNFNYISEYDDNGEERIYSVHIDSGKLYLISYEDDGTIEKAKQSKVKYIKEHSSLIISPEEFKAFGYEYNYNILDIDLLK